MSVTIGRLWVHVFLERPFWDVNLGAIREPGWRWLWVGPLNIHWVVKRG